MNLISKKKSLLKSDEIARIVAVEELAGDSVAHDGAAVIKNDGGGVVDIVSASDPESTLKKYEKAIVLNKFAPKIEYLAVAAKTKRRNKNFVGIETNPLSSESGEPISCKIILEFSPLLKQKAIYAKVYRLMNGANQLGYKDFAADIGEHLKPVVTQTVQSFLDDNGGPERFVGANAHGRLRTFAELQLQTNLDELGLQFKDLLCELQNEATWRGKSDKFKKLSAALQNAQKQNEDLKREHDETKERYEQTSKLEKQSSERLSTELQLAKQRGELLSIQLQNAQKQNEDLKRERDETKECYEQANELEKQRYAQEWERNKQKQQDVDTKQSELIAIAAKELREMKEVKSDELTQQIQGLQKQRDALLKQLESREVGDIGAPNREPAGHPANRRPDPVAKRVQESLKLAEEHLEMDNHDLALDSIDQAIRMAPRSIEAHKLLGKVKEGNRDFDGALAAYEQVVTVAPKDKDNYRDIARIKEGNRDFDGALVAYEKLLKLDPQHIDALRGFAWSKYQKGTYNRALVAFKKVLKLDPQHIDALNGFAWSKYQKGDYDGAIVAFKKALKLDPQYKAALRGLAWSKYRQGDYDGAIVAYEKLLELDPQHKDALRGLAWSKYRKRDYDGALVAYEKVLERDPQNIDALHGFAWSKHGKRDYDGALAAFNKVLELDPQHQGALAGIARIKKSRGLRRFWRSR